MKIFNKTKNRIIAEDVLVSKTFEEKTVGLTKYTSPRAMYFEMRWGTCPVPSTEHKDIGGKLKHILRNVLHPIVDFPLLWCGVHTFGMQFSIDIAVLDEKGIVRALKKNIPPRHFFFWNSRWKRVLELPAGSEIDVGDELEFAE